MKRKRRISRLMREIRRLRKENKQLHDKYWNECRQIALYDDELKEIKRMSTIYDFSRMCRANKDCEFCPMTKAKMTVDCECSTCAEMMADHPDEANAAILKWCTEHPEQQEKPKKTYKEDFLEKFPNAELDVNGNPRVCRISCYGYCNCSAIGSCAACWNEVMPDD